MTFRSDMMIWATDLTLDPATNTNQREPIDTILWDSGWLRTNPVAGQDLNQLMWLVTGAIKNDTLDPVLNLSDVADAATARANIGAGTGGGDLLAANNLSDVANTTTARTNLGAGTGNGDMLGSNNLSDVTVAATARTNIGAGTGNGDLLAANDLTDVASAPVAFANIKQAATTVTTGVSERATDAETQTGTDTERHITPANLTSRTATEIRTGIAEVATTAEVDTGTDDARIVTPLKLSDRLTAIKASQSQANVGTNNATYITPLTARTGREFTLLKAAPVNNSANTLASAWDTFEEILFVTSAVVSGDREFIHHTVYTDLAVASDSTTIFNLLFVSNSDSFIRGNLQLTDKTQFYLEGSGTDDLMVNIYGRYPKT